MIGQSFGGRTVVAFGTVVRGGRSRRWALTACRCGARQYVDPSSLRRGLKIRCKSCANTITSTTHGRSKSNLYRIWHGVLDRCRNPKATGYHRYGGRGITVCKRWASSFECFAGDVGPRPSKRHSLERVNNNGPYAPHNVIWGTAHQQSRNTRRTIRVTIDGVTRVLTDAANIAGVHPQTARGRLKRGVAVKRAFDPQRMPGHADARRIAVNGCKMTIEHAARWVGISKNTLRSHLQRGWPVARAIEPNDHRRAQ